MKVTRTPTVGVHPTFVSGLGQLIEEKILKQTPLVAFGEPGSANLVAVQSLNALLHVAMTKLLKDVAVVIPVFNEEKLIGECIDEWLKF